MAIGSMAPGKSFGEVVLLLRFFRASRSFLFTERRACCFNTSSPEHRPYRMPIWCQRMLTAIQDFVHDSFSSQQSDTLNLTGRRLTSG